MDTRIYESLANLRIPYDNEGNELSYGPDDIYSKILPAFGGNVISGADARDDDFMTPQRSGTCSWGATSVLVQQHTGNRAEYKQLMLSIKCQALIDWAANKSSINSEEENLIRLSCEALSRYAINNFDKQLISENDLKATLDVIEMVYAKYGIRKISVVNMETTDTALQYTNDEILFSALSNSRPMATSDTSIASPVSKTNTFNIGFEGLTPGNLANKLDEFTNQIEKALTDNPTRSIEKAISTSIADLVLRTDNDDFWGKLDPESIKQVSRALDRLGDLHFKALQQLPKKERGSHNHMATTVCLMNLARKLAAADKSVRAALKGQPLMMYEEYNVALSTSPYLWVADPSLRRAAEIRAGNLYDERVSGKGFNNNQCSHFR